MLSHNYKKLTLDVRKRHFVFGDIHGRYGSFLDLLNAIEYDEKTDVLYSVGDLIDRGPQSVEVVTFWENHPDRHIARGNHEQMLVNFDEWERVWMYPPNGGPATLASMAHHGRSIEWLKDFCRSLPIVIDVGEDDDEDAFRIVHAEYPRFISNTDLMNVLETESSIGLGESDFLWGRGDITTALNNAEHMRPTSAGVKWNPDWGTRNVFSGHTPTNNVVQMGKARWIDTYRGRLMTCVNVLEDEYISVPVE